LIKKQFGGFKMALDRILAFFLDIALIHFLSTGWMMVLRDAILKAVSPEQFDNPFLLWARSGSHPVFSILIWFTYFSAFLIFFSETPGMALFDLKVSRISKPSARIGWRSGVVRTMGLVLEFATLGFGVLPVFLSSSGRALHDCLSDTMVVRTSVQDLPLLNEMSRI
jgi:uncharacterized RDD family membrane protein YckC